MGGEYRYDEFPQLGNEFPRGQFYFDSQFTNTSRRPAPRPPRRAAATPARTSCWAIRMTALSPLRWLRPISRSSEWAAYIDDTWRVTPHLTISLGSAVGGRAAPAGHIRPRGECRAPTAASQPGGCAESGSASGLRPHRQREFLRRHQLHLRALLERQSAELPVRLLCKPSGTGGRATG